MQERILPPYAASLSQSMRDIGYTLESAIADLIDNSITANSQDVQIFFEILDADNSYVAIIDDGSGMSEHELFEAMRPGSRDPREERDEKDLGRFGLGLKTASFSQCRSLTVVSNKFGSTCAVQWDLDLVSERNNWVAVVLSYEELQGLPCMDLLGEQGTYVLWRKLDRLLEGEVNHRTRDHALDKFMVVENHLSLVFHRYLYGNGYRNRKINISINGHHIEPFDPYCTSNKATQLLREEIIRLEGHEIKIQPYILPHHSKLTRKEHDFYKTRSNFVSNQGAYVYRNGRLMVWGTWFRLTNKGEATKLARVQIDFPNALDEFWTIDIKKSQATPPPQVRDILRQILTRITEQSWKVHKGRGKRLFEAQEQPLWLRYADTDGIRYEVNREHPIVIALISQMPEAEYGTIHEVLTMIERSIPFDTIYSDYVEQPKSFEEPLELDREELKDQLVSLLRLVNKNKDDFTRMVMSLPPYGRHRETTLDLIEELF